MPSANNFHASIGSLHASSGNLPGITESDQETNDVERQATTVVAPSQTSRSQRHLTTAHKGRSFHRLGSSPSYDQETKERSQRHLAGVNKGRSLRRIGSSPSYRRMSINDTIYQMTPSTTNNNDDRETPINFREYLRAERSLKASPFRYSPPLMTPSPLHHHHHHVATVRPSVAAVPDMDSQSFEFDNSDRRDNYYLDDSEYHEEPEEAKRRRREKKRDEAYRQNVHNLAHMGRRGSMLTGDDMLWETLINTEEDMEIEEELLNDFQQQQQQKSQMFGVEEEVMDDKLDESFKSHHHHHSSGVVPWYSPPMQRVFYGKPQVLPHVNWGDLFLDLFFVAAAYNLGVLMISSMNDSDWLRGLLYFIAIFGSLYRTWFNDLTFSSRYTVLDQCHRLIWGLKFFTIGVAIIFITPLNLMSDPKRVDTPAFILALFIESLITFGLNLEIYFKAVGDRTPIKKHARRMILNEDLPTMFFYVVAFVLAILAFFDVDIYGNHHGSSSSDGYDDHRMLAAGASDIDCSSGGRLLLSRMLGASEVGCPSEGYRKLGAAAAGDDDCTCHTGINFSTDDIPMTIVYFSYCFHNVFSFLRQLKLASEKKDIRDRFVPNNLDYVIHRYGEWIMLMIGEGILSLLIVETNESVEYFVVSCFGVLTVMGIHVLVFESQPSTSDAHAIYRSLRAQLVFGILVQTLSLGLIAFGVSFKIMLSAIVADKPKDDSYDESHRRLAATPSVSEDATSALFSGSLAVVLISLELMLTNHKGLKGNFRRLFKSRDCGEFGIVKYVNKSLLILTFFKIGLIAFAATLSQWERNLTEVAVIAFAIVVAMSVSRVVGWGLVHKEDEIRRMLRTAHTNFATSIRGFKRSLSDELLNLIGKSDDGGSSTYSVPLEDDSIPLEEVDDLHINTEVWDTSFECILAFDRAGGIQYINKTALNEFGYSVPSEILGKELSMLFRSTENEDDPLEVKKLGPSSLPPKMIGQQQDGKGYTLHAKKKDGTEFPCVIGLKPIIGTDYISGFIRNSSSLGGFEKISKEGFIAAAAKGDENEIKRMLLDSKIQLNEGDYDRRTALHLASDNGHATVVRVLCEAHADVNVKDRFGNHPLDCAVEKHHSECVQILTRFGAKRGKCGQLTDLMDASMRGDSYDVKVLIDHGNVDVNESCSIGRTALHVAAAQGLEAIVELLCQEGANVNAEDQEKRRPMDLVDEEKHPRLKEILQQYGATSTRPAGVSSLKTPANGNDITEAFGTPAGVPSPKTTTDDILKEASSTPATVSSPKSTASSDDIFEDAFDAIIICDNDGFIQKVNNTAVRLFDYTSKEELVDRRISFVCPGLDSDSNNQITTARRKDGTGFLCMVVSKQNEHTKRGTWWIRDMMSAFNQAGIGLSINNQGELVSGPEYKA